MKKHTEDLGPLISTTELSERLGWTKSKTRRLASSHRIPGTKLLGLKYYFTRTDIEAWLGVTPE